MVLGLAVLQSCAESSGGAEVGRGAAEAACGAVAHDEAARGEAACGGAVRDGVAHDGAARDAVAHDVAAHDEEAGSDLDRDETCSTPWSCRSKF